MRSMFEPLFEGWHDRSVYGLLRKEQLYRSPWWKRAMWRLGWESANAVTATPLRTAKKIDRA